MPKGSSSSFVSAPMLRAKPKTHERDAERRQRRTQQRSRELGHTQSGRRPDRERDRSHEHGDVGDQRRERDAPGADGERHDDREHEVRRRPEDQQPGDLALPPARDQVLRQHPDWLVDEQDEGEQRQHRRRLRVAVADPGVDQVRRDHEQRQRQHERGRRAAAQPGQQQPSLPLLLARALVLRERRVEQGRHRRWRGRTRAGRAARRSRRTPPPRPEHDPDDDDVGGEDDLVRDVDEEVAPADADEIAIRVARDVARAAAGAPAARAAARSAAAPGAARVTRIVSSPSRTRPPPRGISSATRTA